MKMMVFIIMVFMIYGCTHIQSSKFDIPNDIKTDKCLFEETIERVMNDKDFNAIEYEDFKLFLNCVNFSQNQIIQDFLRLCIFWEEFGTNPTFDPSLLICNADKECARAELKIMLDVLNDAQQSIISVTEEFETTIKNSQFKDDIAKNCILKNFGESKKKLMKYLHYGYGAQIEILKETDSLYAFLIEVEDRYFIENGELN